MNAKTYNDVPLEPLSREQLEDHNPDAPEFAARRAAQVDNAGEVHAVSLPMGVWRAIMAPLFNHFIDGAAGVQQMEAMRSLVELNKPEDLAKFNGALADDRELAEVLRYGLGQLVQQIKPSDPFFEVDFKAALAELDERLPGFVVEQEKVDAILSPESVKRRMDNKDAVLREAHAAAQAEVTDELARFALDKSSDGHTLN